MDIKEIVNELESIEILKQTIKSQSMIYQYPYKVKVAECMGVSPEEVDLPYNLWSALSEEHYKKGCCIK